MKTVLIVLAFLGAASAAKVPLREIIPICDAKDPDLNSCIVKSANLLIPRLAKGIKSYGFPPLDPLKIPMMDLGQNSGPVSLELKLINTTHVGLSTLNFHTASIDRKKKQLILNGTLPYYTVEGKYVADGRILLVPVVGDGDANITFNDVGFDVVLTGSPRQEKSASYFDISSFRVYFKLTKTLVSLTNLFNGNKVLGERTAKFIRDNSNEIANSMKSTIEDLYSVLYKSLVQRITSSVPYKELFQNV